jgi:hypothetical protein
MTSSGTGLYRLLDIPVAAGEVAQPVFTSPQQASELTEGDATSTPAGCRRGPARWTSPCTTAGSTPGLAAACGLTLPRWIDDGAVGHTRWNSRAGTGARQQHRPGAGGAARHCLQPVTSAGALDPDRDLTMSQHFSLPKGSANAT